MLFLGAGASKPFGFPTSDEILPQLLRRLRRGRLFRAAGAGRPQRTATRELRALLRQFLPGLEAGRLRQPSITDVLSLVDHLLVTDRAPQPDLSPGALARLRVLLERGVAEVLAHPARSAAPRAALMRRFADWILDRDGGGPGFVTILSTNYDFAMESFLLEALPERSVAAQVDFGVEWRPLGPQGRQPVPRPRAPRLAIYKLHGSLNWLRCPLCDRLYIHPFRALFREGQRDRRSARVACGCGYAPLRHVIVAPSAVREVRDPNLLAIWRNALEALRAADEWIIVGYSLPLEDLALRSMLLRGSRGRRDPPQVTVVQPRRSEQIRARYRLILPEARFDDRGVEGFVATLPRRRRC